MALAIWGMSISSAFAASMDIERVYQDGDDVTVTIKCVGAPSDTSSDTLLWQGRSLTDIIKGKYFYQVCAAPLAVDPPDDSTNLLIYLKLNRDEKVDILGSEDNSTAYHGLNIIDSTTPECAVGNMYIKRAGEHVNHFWKIDNTITIDIDNQTDTTAEYTLTLYFVR